MLKKIFINIFLVVIILLTITNVFPTLTFAADSFETSISAFPESYKPYLRSLHDKHPKWSFEALNTGLDWTDVINAESLYDRSLVTNSSAYTDIFKSREPSDYNASTDTYIQKDSGFVSANKLAISYFMDPRNFLDEKGIFQFEKLSFDSSITVKEIETILKGSFMENKNIEYLNSDGKKKTIKKKYSEVIYNAGKKYDVNPCFLASKIINEVGKSGTSVSVTGKNSTYPGIYNFFNVGAYAGSNAAVNGLKWASNKSNGYGTPWDTPEKAIMGGAQFNAEKYISKGQNTNYLQKFNVNPKASYKLYDHQYMSNLAGVAHPAYLTYQSLLENKFLDNKYIFLIPFYENMPGEKNSTGSVVAADSKNQVGTVTSSCNVRTGPSTQNPGLGFTLPSGTSVSVLDTVFTDATDPDLINRYPFWAKIEFTYSSKSYTGYVYSNFVNIKTVTTVEKGSYSPVIFRTNKYLDLRYISTDPSAATIENDKVIKFLKTGTVSIIAYDSLMHYQVLKYKVVKSTDDLVISNVKVSSVKDTSFKVSFSQNSNYSKYEIYVTDSNNKLIQTLTTTSQSAAISGLKVNTNYKVYVRGLKSNTYSPFSAAVSVKTSNSNKIDKVSGLKASNYKYKSVKLTWNAVSGAQGYKLYTYNSSTKKYTLLKDVGNKTSYTDTSKNAINKTSYSVVAYKTVDGKLIVSGYSSTYAYKPPEITLSKVTSVKQSSATKNSINLTWKKVSNANCYLVYKYSDKDKKYIKYASLTTNSCDVKKLSSNKTYSFKVRAVLKLYGKIYYGPYSSVYTAYTSLADVKNLKISNVTTSSYKLSWSKVSGAKGYEIYKYDSAKKKYVKTKTVTETSYKVSGLSAGKSDIYKVRAYKKTPVGTLRSTFTDLFYASTSPSKPKGLKASNITKNSLKLTWKKVPNANCYLVYKYSDKDKKYIKYASLTTNSCNVKKLSANKTYSFKVRAVIKLHGNIYYGAYSSVYTAYTSLADVKNLKISNVTTSSYKLSWSKVSGAKGYEIYKYDSETKKYVKIKTVTETSYKVTGLSAGKSDIYKVRAYKKTPIGTLKSTFTDLYYASTSPSKPKGLKASNITEDSAKLSWKKISNADGYIVYVLNSKTNEFERVSKVSANSLNLSKLSSKKSYTYVVKAYCKTKSINTFSSMSESLTIKTK